MIKQTPSVQRILIAFAWASLTNKAYARFVACLERMSDRPLVEVIPKVGSARCGECGQEKQG